MQPLTRSTSFVRQYFGQRKKKTDSIPSQLLIIELGAETIDLTLPDALKVTRDPQLRL